VQARQPTLLGATEELRQNDPRRTRFYISLRDERSDADLAQALAAQNAFVTEIAMSLDGEQRSADYWNSLLRVIATRANLGKVELWDSYFVEGRNVPAFVLAFCKRFSKITVIRTVQLLWVWLPTDISTFVDNVSSIT